MSDYDRNPRGPGYPNRVNRGFSSGSWVAGIIIAILVIIAVGYAFSDRWYPGNTMVEHRAAATDTTTAPAASTAPATKAPASTVPASNAPASNTNTNTKQ